MSKRQSFKDFKKTAFKDKAFKAEYEILRPEFELVDQFIKARKKTHLSQIKLAKRLHLQQPTIARLERGGYARTSVMNLSKFAQALGYSLKISLVRKKQASNH
jgi:ribosome-binding protein aMBF1 (putative translation factor)